MSLAPGTTIGSFHLDAIVERRRSTTVYQAHEVESDRIVAIEVLDDTGGDQAPLGQQFLDQARTMQEIDNPALVTIVDVDQTDDGMPYVVTSRVEGDTLADRLDFSPRTTSDADLLRLTKFLADAVGAVHRAGLVHRNISPDNIFCYRPPAETTSDNGGDSVMGANTDDGTDADAGTEDEPSTTTGTTLLDDADQLVLIQPGLDREPAAAASDRTASIHAAPELRIADATVDQRCDVYSASATLAEAASGQTRSPYQTWDSFFAGMESHLRPGLASALWVGLADEPAIRYRTIDQWRRSIEAAVRSDAATIAIEAREALPKQRRRPGTGLLVGAAVAVALAVALGAMLVAEIGPFDGSADGQATTDPGGPTTAIDSPADGATAGADEGDPGSDEGDAGSAQQLSDGECQVVGPLGPLSIDGVTDQAIVIGWTPATQAVNILLDGAYIDTVPADTNQYVVERRPLLPPPLPADTEFKLEIQIEGDGASSACATTASEAAADQRPIGVYAPTGLAVVAQTPTSITVTWDARPGADLHNLFLNGAYVQFGDVGGSTTIGDETEFTFIGLEPGTTYQIGIRRIEGFNQSGMSSVTATTPVG